VVYDQVISVIKASIDKWDPEKIALGDTAAQNPLVLPK
jgi:hypothetical protein